MLLYSFGGRKMSRGIFGLMMIESASNHLQKGRKKKASG
jgi:hypothetical protein